MTIHSPTLHIAPPIPLSGTQGYGQAESCSQSNNRRLASSRLTVGEQKSSAFLSLRDRASAVSAPESRYGIPLDSPDILQSDAVLPPCQPPKTHLSTKM